MADSRHAPSIVFFARISNDLRCILRHALCHPSGVRICFCGLFPGFRPLRGSTAGLFYSAPPGLKFRLAYARKNSPIITPSTSDLSDIYNLLEVPEELTE